MTLKIKRNDTRTAIKAALKSPKGTVVDLTDAEIRFIMSNRFGKVLVDREADIIDAAQGGVAFVFVAGETAVCGPMKAEFEVTYPDGSVETFPNGGYISISIVADLA